MSRLNPEIARKDSPTQRALARQAERTRRRRAMPRWAITLSRTVSVALVVGVACGSVFYAWRAGWLEAAGQAVGHVALEATAGLGFRVNEVLVEGRQGAERATLLSTVGVKRGDPILAFNVADAQRALEQLPWVSSATVERRLPDTIYIRLVERRPMALWQHNQKFYLIDREGTILADKGFDVFKQLPILVGSDAPANAPQLLRELASEPELAERVEAAVRVGGRRWDIKLRNGVMIKLPENDSEVAIHRIAKLATTQALLDRDIVAVDLRLPDRLVVQTAEPSEQPATPATPPRRGKRTGEKT